MLFLRLGIGMGHAPVIARSKPGPLGENQDPTRTNMLHEVEGHVRKHHCQRQLSSARGHPLAAPRTLGIRGA